MTRMLGPAEIGVAIDHLRAGQPGGMPTETVYGLAAPFDDAAAVAAVFTAKGRPADDPLIVHVSPGLWPGLSTRDGLVSRGLIAPSTDERIDLLATALWPGPLTLVLPRGPAISDAITSGLPGVALRMPAHPLALALIDGAGPLVAPSANRFGRISPTSADAVVAELGGRIAWVLDGGACEIGVESTVLRLDADGTTLLRPGAVSAEVLTDLLGPSPRLPAGRVAGPQPAPGMLDRHYAPRTPLVLAPLAWTDEALAALRARLRSSDAVGFLGWREAPSQIAGHPVIGRALSPGGDVAEAARGLFAALRDLDGAGVGLIVAERCPSTTGLGAAIADRLRRASAGTPPL